MMETLKTLDTLWNTLLPQEGFTDYNIIIDSYRCN